MADLRGRARRVRAGPRRRRRHIAAARAAANDGSTPSPTPPTTGSCSPSRSGTTTRRPVTDGRHPGAPARAPRPRSGGRTPSLSGSPGQSTPGAPSTPQPRQLPLHAALPLSEPAGLAPPRKPRLLSCPWPGSADPGFDAESLLRSLMENIPGAIYRAVQRQRLDRPEGERRDREASRATPRPTSAMPRFKLISVTHPEDRDQDHAGHRGGAQAADPPVGARVPRGARRRRDPLGPRARGRRRSTATAREWVDGIIFDVSERRAAEQLRVERELEAQRVAELEAVARAHHRGRPTMPGAGSSATSTTAPSSGWSWRRCCLRTAENAIAGDGGGDAAASLHAARSGARRRAGRAARARSRHPPRAPDRARPRRRGRWAGPPLRRSRSTSTTRLGERLSAAAIETALYYVVAEALTNVDRYSAASRATVSLPGARPEASRSRSRRRPRRRRPGARDRTARPPGPAERDRRRARRRQPARGRGRGCGRACRCPSRASVSRSLGRLHLFDELVDAAQQDALLPAGDALQAGRPPPASSRGRRGPSRTRPSVPSKNAIVMTWSGLSSLRSTRAFLVPRQPRVVVPGLAELLVAPGLDLPARRPRTSSVPTLLRIRSAG